MTHSALVRSHRRSFNPLLLGAAAAMSQVGGAFNPFKKREEPRSNANGGQVGNSWNSGWGNGAAAVFQGLNWEALAQHLTQGHGPIDASPAARNAIANALAYRNDGGPCAGACGGSCGGANPYCGPCGSNDPRVKALTDGPCAYYQEPLGFDSVTAVAAGATVTLSATPLVVYRPRQLSISPSIADSFAIMDIVSGKKHLFAGGTVGIPASMYTPDSTASSFQGMVVQPNTPVLLIVQNTSANALRFRAGMIGEATE